MCLFYFTSVSFHGEIKALIFPCQSLFVINYNNILTWMSGEYTMTGTSLLSAEDEDVENVVVAVGGCSDQPDFKIFFSDA